METPRKFIIALLRKFIIAIINLRGVSTKLNKYIVFTMQTYKKLIRSSICFNLYPLAYSNSYTKKLGCYTSYLIYVFNYASYVTRKENPSITPKIKNPRNITITIYIIKYSDQYFLTCFNIFLTKLPAAYTATSTQTALT